MNREQRRAASRKQPSAARGLTKTQRINALIRNGITPDDVHKAYEEGWHEGFQQAAPNITRTVYAAAVLAMRDEKPRWGRKRCKRMLENLDRHVIETLNSKEAIDRVWNEIGLLMDFQDPIDPIKEA